MKKITIMSLLLVTTSFNVYAQTKGYIEGQISYNKVQDVDTKTYSGTSGGLTFTNLKGKLEYDSDIGYGVEAGVSEFLNKNVRVGLSYGQSKMELKKASGSGTVTDGTTTVNFGASVTRADLSSVGLGSVLDNDVKNYSLNAYYDFDKVNNLIPFIGVGLGQADIQNAKDKELSKSLYLGARYFVDKNLYVGGKGTYSIIDGPEDKLGIKYEDIKYYAVTLGVGYQF
jgi:opacity protein-like surface antigen